jgi:spore maturation protein CgeB
MAAGLRACGHEVAEYPLHITFETAELLVGAAKTMGIAPPGGYPDPIDLGVMGIPGFVMAKRAELVIFIHGLNMPASVPTALRRGGYKTALYCTESPYETDREANTAQFYDYIFTNERSALPRFTNNPPHTVHYLPHGYNPARHTPDGERMPACDVFFCGTRYPERDALLSGVDWTGIDVVDRSLDYAAHDSAALFERIVDNAVAAAHYRSARISLNHHRRIKGVQGGGEIARDEAESLGPRPYEVAACGGFLVSDARAELSEVFGDSVPIYHDSATLEALIRYYLAHEDERAALAARQHAAVQSHSWAARAARLLDIIQHNAHLRAA